MVCKKCIGGNTGLTEADVKDCALSCKKTSRFVEENGEKVCKTNKEIERGSIKEPPCDGKSESTAIKNE